MRSRWFFSFFLVSGFCSLVYQVVWLRLCMARFGVTTAMVSIVVSVFMAGLALGSWIAGRIAGRLPPGRPELALRLYAVCEVVIALSAGAVPAGLQLGRELLLRSDLHASWGSAGYHAASGLGVALVLLPFCVAMGATFPLALQALGARVEGGRSSFGHLYLANVLGAAAGTLLSAFVLIEILGFAATLSLAAALNALLAATALGLSVLPRGVAAQTAAASEGPSRAGGRSLRLALFATGLASMGMEVVWVRLFTPMLGNVVYAFAIILAAYLLATSAGSMLYRARSAALTDAPAPPAGLWATVVVTAMLPLVSADPRLPFAATFVEGNLPLLRSVALVALGVAPFCALLGFVTPWLVDRFSGGSAKLAGSAYAVNAMGCVVGPPLVGFLLLPRMDERWTLCGLALLLLGPGLLARPRPGQARWQLPLALAAALFIALLAPGYGAHGAGGVVRRDATATVIATGKGASRQLLVNGVGVTYLTPITKMMAHLPLASLQSRPRRGLVICFGMGTSFRAMHSWGIETTGVELVPSVPLLFGYFHGDADRVLRSPTARVVVDDGRRFLDRSDETWDVIVVDPPPPVEAAGSSLLYSREFYESAARRLAPAGILQAWAPGAEPAVIASFLLAAGDVFPHLRVFPSVEGWGLHVLASREPIPRRSAAELAALLPPAAAADLVEWGPQPTPEAQFQAVLAQERLLDRVALRRSAVPLTDDRPFNEYFFVRRLLAPLLR